MPIPSNSNGNRDHRAGAALDTADRHTHLPLLTAPVRFRDGQEEHPLARQWRLLKLLTYSPKGFTVKELVALSGMSDKTVRRDLIFLQDMGFDMF